MAILNATNQYRTLTHLYLFKEKAQISDNNNSTENVVILKIYDISQKCISKTTFSYAQLGIPPSQFSKTDPYTLVDTLIQKKLIVSENAPIGVTIEECIKDIEQLIAQEKPKIVFESKELETLSCPITLEVFKDPVMDNHGHTFEKSAIEEHRSKNNNNCPISRQPITSLTPNLDIKRIIGEAQRKDPIPTLALFKKENLQLAASSLKIAQEFIEAEEYDEALSTYTKAFQYTQAWADYQKLLLLFTQMGQKEKARLATLYLIQYQLQDKKIEEALITVDEFRKNHPEFIQISHLLFKLYQLAQQPQKALACAMESAELLAKEHPQKAIDIYKKIIAADPHQFKVYQLLASLLKDPREKAHILLKGACHAIQKKQFGLFNFSTASDLLSTASELCSEAEKSYPDSFIDRLVSPTSFFSRGKFLQIATLYEKKNLTTLMIKAYRALLQYSYDPIYYEKIITGYDQINKPEKALQWTLHFLTLLIEKQEWEQAEKVSLQALKRTEKKLPLYEQQEIVYTNWNNHQLSDLWPKLGKAYLQGGQLAQAEKIYQKAYQKFNTFESAIALADILIQQDKKALGVQTYYQASAIALLEDRLEDLSLCAKSIKQIDPKMEHLELSQRMTLLIQSRLFEFSNEVKVLRAEIEKLKISPTPVPLINIPESKKIISLPAIAFGAAKWAEYIGDVGIEPPLPSNIDEILASPCPFFHGKTVGETHLLTLIPHTVRDKPFTLNRLDKLVQSRKMGSKTQYAYYWDELKKGVGEILVKESYWVLFTKDVIPNSRKKTYKAQKQLVEAKESYQVPSLLEAATSILMEYVQSGTRLYKDDPPTYTRCQEYHGHPVVMVVGSFGLSGLRVGNSSLYVEECLEFQGVGGVRRLPLPPSSSPQVPLLPTPPKIEPKKKKKKLPRFP